MATEVQLIAATVVLFRRQFEAERGRLVLLAAVAGGVGSSSFHAALDGRWGEFAVGIAVVLVCGALFEWRWKVAMRIPGTTPDEWRQVRAAGSPAPDDSGPTFGELD